MFFLNELTSLSYFIFIAVKATVSLQAIRDYRSADWVLMSEYYLYTVYKHISDQIIT